MLARLVHPIQQYRVKTRPTPRRHTQLRAEMSVVRRRNERDQQLAAPQLADLDS